jgi:hypothetical protein
MGFRKAGSFVGSSLITRQLMNWATILALLRDMEDECMDGAENPMDEIDKYTYPTQALVLVDVVAR